MPVAATFAYEEEDSAADEAGSTQGLSSLSDVAQLDTLVTVVDGERFVSDVMGAESLAERDMQADEEDERTVADLLVEQVRVDTNSEMVQTRWLTLADCR